MTKNNNKFLNLLKSELFFCLHDVKVYILFGISLVCSILFNAIPVLFSYVSFTCFALEIILLILIVKYAHRDLSQNTLNNIVSRGFSYKQVYFARWITCCCLVLIFLFVYHVVDTIFCGAHGALRAEIIPIRLLDILCFVLKFSVVFTICSIIKSGALSVLVSIGYLYIIEMVSTLIAIQWVQDIQQFLIYSTQGLFRQVIFEGYSWVEDQVFWHMLISVGVVAALVVGGSFLFEKIHKK